MMDMSAVITPKSDQISADDLIGGPITVTITGVKIRAEQEQKVDISLAGQDRVYRPCKSMSRVLVAAWGADAKAYVGRSLTLYRDPTVKWGGMEVGGIRICAMSHIDRKMVLALTVTKGNRKPHLVDVLAAGAAARAPVAAVTPAGYDAALAAARNGRDAFAAHWKALPPEGRAALKPYMGDLEAAAKAAATSTEDPFGLPPPDLARAEAEALAAIRKQDEEIVP